MPHRGSSPPLISLPLLIILLPILTLTLLFLAVPPLLSAATNALQHSPVKTTWNWNWNSFNIILVFVAILFGVFARRNEDESSPQQSSNDAVPDQIHSFRRVSVSSERVETSGGYESQQWFGFSSDETPNRLQSPVTGVNRLRRSSSSYPDLRQMETDDSRYKFRFFDDFEIEKQFRSPSRAAFSTPYHRKQLPEYRSQEEEQVHVKEIPVDTFQTRPSPVKTSSPPPPPPPPPTSRRRHSQSMHQTVESRSEITELEDPEFARIDSPPPTPPRPSAKTRSEQKHGKNERKKSNVKREIAMVWASVLSNQRKRKKKQRSGNDHNHHYDNVDEFTNNTTVPPPPPPPLPPPSVFHSIFRKGMGKSKKIYSVPPPPPPPPASRRSSKPENKIPQPPPSPPASRRSSKQKNQIPQPPPSRISSKPKNQLPQPPLSPPPTPPRQGNRMKPPLPNKSTNSINDTLNVGNQSPLIPIPPPLPPFKIPAMKFELRGDFVKILSNQSSRCTSPEREHIDGEVSEREHIDGEVQDTTMDTNSVMNHKSNGNAYVFCPSPDVNAKAATFIARLRGEWRLQKLNSIKEKGNGSLPLAKDLLH